MRASGYKKVTNRNTHNIYGKTSEQGICSEFIYLPSNSYTLAFWSYQRSFSIVVPSHHSKENIKDALTFCCTILESAGNGIMSKPSGTAASTWDCSGCCPVGSWMGSSPPLAGTCHADGLTSFQAGGSKGNQRISSIPNGLTSQKFKFTRSASDLPNGRHGRHLPSRAIAKGGIGPSERLSKTTSDFSSGCQGRHMPSRAVPLVQLVTAGS